MVKISKECIDEALKSFNTIGADELKDYVRDVFNRARKKDNLSSSQAFEQAIKEANNDAARSLFESASIKANNTAKYEKNANKIRDKKVPMRSLLTKRYTNLGDNVASAQWSAKYRLSRKAFDSLEPAEIDFLASKDNQYLIADAIDGLKVNNPTAEKIAKIFNDDYIPYRNGELITSNAMTLAEMNKDRNFRYIHNAEKLLSGGQSFINAIRNRGKYDTTQSKPLWIAAIKKHFDMEATFENTSAMGIDGKIDWAEADKILSSIYDNITTGRSEIFTRSVVANDRDAVQRKSRMFFKPKSMRDFVTYNEMYGQGDLYTAWVSDIHGAGSKIGMSEMFGDSPYSMYNDLRKVQVDAGINEVGGWDMTDKYLGSVMGTDKASKSASASNFFSNLRTLTSMARLPKIALQSVSDVAYIASFAQRMGINYWRAYFNQLGHIFDRFPNEERSRIAKLYKLSVDSHMGYVGRWVDAANSSQILNKVSSAFFRKVGLEAFDRGNKVGMMHLMAKHLSENSKKFSELNPSLQKWISKFMDEKDWELLRTKNQNGLFTVENAERLTDKELRDHYGDVNVPLYQVKNDLYRRIDSMFQVASENAVLAPTEFERAWLYQGQRPGTVLGEGLRVLTQFKSYTMAYIDRVLVQGWKDADTAQQKLGWATSMMMGTIPLAVLSTYLDNLSNGLSMPDWNEMNVADREKFLLNLIAPSLAIFSGVLDSKNQNSDMIFSFFKSPSTRLISNSLAAGSALVTGDPKGALKDLKKVSEYMLPISTLPFASPFIRQMFGDQAYLEPGQKVLYGA